jgi:hypothetical protein
MSAAFTTPGVMGLGFGYSIDGQLNSFDISCNLITNANKNKIQFINLGGTRGSIFIGQKPTLSSTTAAIPVLKVTLLQEPGYGGCHCEFIICGTHNGIAGFLIKYEFLLCQTNNVLRIFNIDVESASDSNIPGTTIGWHGSDANMVLPTLTHANTGSGFNSYKTFSVFPAKNPNDQSQNPYGAYTIFFRMSNGGFNPFAYEIL